MKNAQTVELFLKATVLTFQQMLIVNQVSIYRNSKTIKVKAATVKKKS